jgi:hypothetical protein
MKIVLRLIILGLITAACGGAAATTTVAEATTTTLGTGQTGDTVAFEDLPAECKRLVGQFLQAIEPVVRDIDFDSATVEELNEMSTQLEEQTSEFETTLNENCPDIGGEDSQDALLDLARSEAPGAVAYLQFIFRMMEGFTGEDGAGVSGDCETDIAAALEVIQGGGTAADLTMAEMSQLSALMGAIGQECSLEKANEFYEREDVQAFLADMSN